ncbi:hypothetical protein [Bacillus atrophaeus]|uniref:hypothetical protein n=1 Tax=Bacillus atrophaeus TaxID=1452 RepID=UPI00077AC0E2|nr:hypothetical protein [Bacillus atrophaeus]KXZ13261.1 hypothetical protein AXI57_16025 [Bacillus atrophaeus]MED4806332.1 hypothetical protein [Bacillus atrophaeus]
MAEQKQKKASKKGFNHAGVWRHTLCRNATGLSGSLSASFGFKRLLQQPPSRLDACVLIKENFSFPTFCGNATGALRELFCFF